ncbi:MAG: HDOD domain-containing protein [Methyloprofundus sp.]|nr:HDOD domain-containing protein [Methyloprofundus sp.]
MFWKKLFVKNVKSKSRENNNKSVVQNPGTTRKIAVKQLNIALPFLQKLHPIRLLSAPELKQIEVLGEDFESGQIIYREGDPLGYLAYIIDGEVLCENAIGAHYEVVADTFKALYPLSSSDLNLFTAIAKTKVKVIYLPQDLLLDSSRRQVKTNIDQLAIAGPLQKIPFGQKLLSSIQAGSIEVPSLPDVALRLRMAVQKDIGIAEAVKIVNLDPKITARLIQVANSPLYRGVNSYVSCYAALNRLGLNATRNLVTSFSMQALFTSKNKLLTKKMHQAWQQSVKVSSLCHTLALLTKKADPEEALLAGLTHNIGILPIVKLADQQEKLSFENLEACLRISQAYIGQMVLAQWDFPETVVKIPYLIDNWFYQSGTDFGLIDIVILAKYHSLLGTEYMSFLPALHDLPAFQKMGAQALTSDMSLQILHDAKQQVADSMSLFGA